MVTPLGITLAENFQNMLAGKSGIHKIPESGFQKENWPLSQISNLNPEHRYRDLLAMVCDSLLVNCSPEILHNDRTLIIVSTTKGDINALPKDPFASTRKIIADKLKPVHAPLIISNACISGVLAVGTAADYIDDGRYDQIIVIGIDALSDFIVYGFQSLFALSEEPSKPFDKNRTGISIGEAAGALIVSKEKSDRGFCTELLSYSSSNDANHISGPSRTGEGLVRCVRRTIQRAGIDPNQIDFISAHGTGTLYNDDMESIAFDRLELSHVPMNSMKGYFGHTLGAAGVIEILATMSMMQNGILLRSPGFEENGTVKAINV
ncbi:MAG: hypothetical protein A3D92_01940, partial [Bacteroidetes bacterium RIFCSPHIGHO2_02_FULL_44_7]